MTCTQKKETIAYLYCFFKVLGGETYDFKINLQIMHKLEKS